METERLLWKKKLTLVCLDNTTSNKHIISEPVLFSGQINAQRLSPDQTFSETLVSFMAQNREGISSLTIKTK